MKRFKTKMLGVLIVLLIQACSSSDNGLMSNTGGTPADPTEIAYSALFIGNSLTYTNDIPGLLEETASTQGYTMTASSVAFGGYGLEDHWNEGSIQTLIESREYDFVIIQQGPSSQADGKASLIEYGGKIATLCQAHGVKLVYYMVWPSLTYYKTFDGVIANYTEAAAMSNSRLAPVGSVWKAHFDATDDFSYYGPDGFHPSLEGSRVAAEVIFESLEL